MISETPGGFHVPVPLTALGVASVLVGLLVWTVRTFAPKLFTMYVASRDEEYQRLRGDYAALVDRVAKDLRAEVSRLNAENAELRAKVSELEVAHARAEAELHAMQARLDLRGGGTA